MMLDRQIDHSIPIMSPKIFLSYAKEDKTQVDRIYTLLRSAGLDPWMDKPPVPFQMDGIQPGERWDDCIRREMNAADYVCAFLSTTSVSKKGYVQREYRLALQILENFPPDQVFLIPILLDDCTPPDLRVGTTSIRDLQFYDYQSEGISHLLRFIKRASGIEHALAAPVDRPEIELAPDRFVAPKITWSAAVGAQKWKNTPVFFDNTLFAGSAGSKWNEPDSEDGIYALHASDGSLRWFCPTSADANQILVTDEYVVCGTDDGHVMSCDRLSGNEIWRAQVGSGVLHRPIMTHEGRLAVLGYRGRLTLLNIQSGEPIAEIQLDGHFIADPVFDPANARIIAPAIEGSIFVIDVQNDKLALIRKHDLRHIGFDGRFEPPELYCSPIPFNDVWIQGFARETYFDNPAFLALDLEASKDPIVWYATDPSRENKGYGNIRATPLLIDDSIIFGGPYSQAIVGLNANNGVVDWLTNLGMPMFPHWPSPIASASSIYLPRHDGYLYEIDRVSHQKNWSIFLGKHQFAGIQEQITDYDFEGNPTSRFSESGNWDPLFGSPIFATPCLDKESEALFVGTDEGFLYKIDLKTRNSTIKV